jgi:hypothetical protein
MLACCYCFCCADRYGVACGVAWPRRVVIQLGARACRVGVRGYCSSRSRRLWPFGWGCGVPVFVGSWEQMARLIRLHGNRSSPPPHPPPSLSLSLSLCADNLSSPRFVSYSSIGYKVTDYFAVGLWM